MYGKIVSENRLELEYFRVGFYGKGFPAFLQNRVYVYRGHACERLADFSNRILDSFPQAKLYTSSLDEPEDEVKNSPYQYLQISSVTPVWKRKGVGSDDRKILWFHQFNGVQRFQMDRKIPPSSAIEKELGLVGIQRKFLVTSYPFPGILRSFQVISTEKVTHFYSTFFYFHSEFFYFSFQIFFFHD